MRLLELHRRKQHLDHLFGEARALPDPELKSHWARYLCVLVSGFVETSVLALYREYFHEVYGVRQIDGYWLTHVPMHPECMSRARGNVHGHLHANTIPDPRYLNVSVECVDYTPVSFDTARERLKLAL